MECNKDEAERAKEISEQKFKMKDFTGAKKFALKAQNLYPEIEGVSQMIATLDVYVTAENKVNGEVNWYDILNASPRDDNETLKKKYRKLALMLHPDKNNSIGAEGAFKHVSEAWKFLSDQEKRAAYDRRRSLHTVYQKVSLSSSNNGFCNIPKTSFTSKNNQATQKSKPATQKNSPATKKSNPATQKNNPEKPVGNTKKSGRTDHNTTTPSSVTASGSSDQTKLNTFWTVCRRCMMQYEYLRVYINCNLLCPNCLQSFSAIEAPKPDMSSIWSSFTSVNRNLDPKSAANQSSTSGNSKWTFSKTNNAAHAANVVQQAYEKVKKNREEAKATAKKVKKNAKRKNQQSASGSSLKKRKVIGETEIDCSNGRKVTYYVTGETDKNMRKLHGTKEKAEKLCPGIQKRVTRRMSQEIKSD